MRNRSRKFNQGSPASHKQGSSPPSSIPMQILMDDPLDLTVVHEDTQGSPGTGTGAHDEFNFTTMEARHESRKKAQTKSSTTLHDKTRRQVSGKTIGQNRRMNQLANRKQSMDDFDDQGKTPTSNKLARSPSSSAATPQIGMGIQDIKSASLYDLIKLQMINQQQMMKKERKQSPLRQNSKSRSKQLLHSSTSKARLDSSMDRSLTRSKKTIQNTIARKNSSEYLGLGGHESYRQIKGSTSRRQLHDNHEVIEAPLTRNRSSVLGKSNVAHSRKKVEQTSSTLHSKSSAGRLQYGGQSPSKNSTSKVPVLSPKSSCQKSPGRQSQQVATVSLTITQTDDDEEKPRQLLLSDGGIPEPTDQQMLPSQHEHQRQTYTKKQQSHQQKVASQLSQPKVRSPAIKGMALARRSIGLNPQVTAKTMTKQNNYQSSEYVRLSLVPKPTQTVESSKKSTSTVSKRKIQLGSEKAESVSTSTAAAHSQLNSDLVSHSSSQMYGNSKPTKKKAKKSKVSSGSFNSKAQKTTKHRNAAEDERVQTLTISQHQYPEKILLDTERQTEQTTEQTDFEDYKQVTDQPFSMLIQREYGQEEVDDSETSGVQLTRVTAERVSRAERSRSRSERLSLMKKKQQSTDNVTSEAQLQAMPFQNAAVQQEESVSLEQEGLAWTPNLQEHIQSLVHEVELIQCKAAINTQSQVCLSDRAQYATNDQYNDLKTPELKYVEKCAETPLEFLMVEKEDTNVQMFENDLLQSVEDEREQIERQQQSITTTSSQLLDSDKPDPSFLPSPMKPQTCGPRNFCLTRKSIKNILSQFTLKCIQDIVRIKKPQKASQLIGQLFCMMLWVYRESTSGSTLAMSQNDDSHLPKVPFQNLEDEFSSWENVQTYLNKNVIGMFQELQNMLQKFPFPKPYAEQYLRKMQHKIHVEQRCLNRVANTSLERALSLVQAVCDWHCKSLSSLNHLQEEQQDQVEVRRISLGGEGPSFRRTSSMGQITEERQSLDSSMAAWPKVYQQKNKQTTKQTQIEQPMFKNKRTSHQFKKGAASDPNEMNDSIVAILDESTPTLNCHQRKQQRQDSSEQLPRHTMFNIIQQNSNPSGGNLQSASPTSTNTFAQNNNNLNSRSNNNTGSSLLQSTTSSRNKMVTARSVTHFSRQQMVSPAEMRRAPQPYETNASFTRPDNQDDRLFQDQDMEEDDDEPINLVLENGVVSTKVKGKQANQARITEKTEEDLTNSQVELSYSSTQNRARRYQTFGQDKLYQHNFLNNRANLDKQQQTKQTNRVKSSQSKEKVTSTAPNTLHPIKASDNEPDNNEYTIKLYQPRKTNAAWTDEDSDDSFRIEPTNVGAYYERQERLHEALQSNSFDSAANPRAMPISVPSADETRQMIQELREKHLLRGSTKLPASPMSVAAVAVDEDVDRVDQSLADVDVQIATDRPTTPLESINNIEGANAADESFSQSKYHGLSYQEWQKKHFDNVLQALERDNSASKSRQANHETLFQTVEKVEQSTIEKVEAPLDHEDQQRPAEASESYQSIVMSEKDENAQDE